MSEKDLTPQDRDALRQLSAWLGHRQWYALSDEDSGKVLAALGRLLHGPADLSMAFRVGEPVRPRTEQEPTDLAGALASREMLRVENDSLRAALAEALGLLEHRVTWSDMPRDAQKDRVDAQRIAELRARFLK